MAWYDAITKGLKKRKKQAKKIAKGVVGEAKEVAEETGIPKYFREAPKVAKATAKEGVQAARLGLGMATPWYRQGAQMQGRAIQAMRRYARSKPETLGGQYLRGGLKTVEPIGEMLWGPEGTAPMASPMAAKLLGPPTEPEEQPSLEYQPPEYDFPEAYETPQKELEAPQPGKIHYNIDEGFIEFKGLRQRINLSDEQRKEFQKLKLRSIYESEDPKVNTALQMALANETAGMAPTVPPVSGLTTRNIYGSTLREGMGEAVTSALPSAIIAGAATGNVWVGAGAFMAASIGSLYGSYIGNQQEEVDNAFKGFQGVKTGVSKQVTAVKAGAVSPAQAQLNLNYMSTQIDASIAFMRQKQAEGKFVADVSDYDGKMAYMEHYRNLYLTAARAEINQAVREQGYSPREIFVPSYEELKKGKKQIRGAL